MIRKTTLAVTCSVLLGLLCSCGGEGTNTAGTANAGNSGKPPVAAANTPAPAVRKAEMTVTADALAKEYDADPKSMEKYKDKLVEITGTFDRSAGSESAPEVKFDTADSSVDVTCRLSPSAIQAAAKLEKGQPIKLVGTGDPYSIIGPLFKDCQMSS